MDPTVTLREARKQLEQFRKASDDGRDASALASALRALELFQSLDEWLTRGGFRPVQWR